MHRIFSTLVLLMVALFHVQPVQTALAWQDPNNLLQNPGFEGDYYAWMNLNTAQVAHGWTPWWRPRNDGDPPAHYFQPEYKQHWILLSHLSPLSIVSSNFSIT